ncbi:MAG: spondin domain-containing protein [Coleofasciculus sp. C1-SOL-03]|jgi:hypothetical protein|uniref:spondin domain-containing protein n=1 Tax=Coleofasciculus sp. C1-SOL-03 TaxID=3069522 RepID=UPI003300D756
MKNWDTTVLKNRGLFVTAIAVGSTLTMASTATAATMVKVTVENLAPESGLVVTPLWVGFHDGSFDSFNLGEPASNRIERLAEDGNTAPIAQAFLNSGAGSVEGTLLGPGLSPDSPPVIPANATASQTFTLDGNLASSQYFSYGAMIVPSNDAFIGNDNPLAFQIFDDAGNFLGADFMITGNQVWDAGTEVNDEIPENTALLGQMMPNTGEDENGVVTQHPGFIPGGNILTAFPNADFTTPTSPSYQVARIRVEQVQVPEPATAAGLFALGGFFILKRRLRRNTDTNSNQ